MTNVILRKSEKGNNLGSLIGSIEECQNKCDELQNCWSFVYFFEATKCFFKDKKVLGQEKMASHNRSTTVYKTCKDGMHDLFYLSKNFHLQ